MRAESLEAMQENQARLKNWKSAVDAMREEEQARAMAKEDRLEREWFWEDLTFSTNTSRRKRHLTKAKRAGNEKESIAKQRRGSRAAISRFCCSESVLILMLSSRAVKSAAKAQVVI